MYLTNKIWRNSRKANKARSDYPFTKKIIWKYKDKNANYVWLQYLLLCCCLHEYSCGQIFRNYNKSFKMASLWNYRIPCSAWNDWHSKMGEAENVFLNRLQKQKILQLQIFQYYFSSWNILWIRFCCLNEVKLKQRNTWFHDRKHTFI